MVVCVCHARTHRDGVEVVAVFEVVPGLVLSHAHLQ